VATHRTSHVGISIGIVAALTSAIWFYIQLQEWRAHGHDYTGLVVNIISELAMWVLSWPASAIRKN
jgi:hypothetical protein